MRDKSSGFSVEDISSEKKLLKSVEGLISAIKSGQLVKEQETSSKRIQEILGSVLDKASLSLLDPSFRKEDTSILEEENEYDELDRDALDGDYQQQQQQSSSLINDTSNLLKVPSTTRYSTSRHSTKSGGDVVSSKADTTSQIDQENPLMDPSSRSLHNDAEGYYLDTERGVEMVGGSDSNQVSNNIDSLMAEYEKEMQAYLASLSPTVTYEEILNTRAHKVKIFEKEKSTKRGKAF
jgi:hypothetical protein